MLISFSDNNQSSEKMNDKFKYHRHVSQMVTSYSQDNFLSRKNTYHGLQTKFVTKLCQHLIDRENVSENTLLEFTPLRSLYNF